MPLSHTAGRCRNNWRSVFSCVMHIGNGLLIDAQPTTNQVNCGSSSRIVYPKTEVLSRCPTIYSWGIQLLTNSLFTKLCAHFFSKFLITREYQQESLSLHRAPSRQNSISYVMQDKFKPGLPPMHECMNFSRNSILITSILSSCIPLPVTLMSSRNGVNL